MTAPGASGFFGKLPSAGDFLQRRLPPVFVEACDGQLSRLVDGARQRLGGAWPSAYRGSPLLAFLLAPGIAGPGGWAGVIAPAQDRVGRCFPMVVAGTPVAPSVQADDAGGWFTRAALLLADALVDPSCGVEPFDARVAALGTPRHLALAAGGLWWPVLPSAQTDPQFFASGWPTLEDYIAWLVPQADLPTRDQDITERTA